MSRSLTNQVARAMLQAAAVDPETGRARGFYFTSPGLGSAMRDARALLARCRRRSVITPAAKLR